MTSAYLNLNDLEPDDKNPPSPLPAGSSAEPGKRSIRYLRVSSRAQMDTDSDVVADGNSIDSQRKATTAKEQALGLINVDEYIEPGNSGQTIAGRPVFQQLLSRIITKRDVDYLVVDMRSRAFRNHIDAAVTKQQLLKLGVRLISAQEDFGEGIMADAMEAITDIFNEVQVRLNGLDIKNKMGNKAKNGGTIGRAPLGYLNIRRSVDGKELRTITLDPDRAPLVRLAFELYATSDYTLADLSDELYDRGLRTRPTARHPAKQVSLNKVSQLLRDRYYLGYVIYQGEEIHGRHEPLIDEDLFDRVQDILESRSIAKERRRVHHHYLKGSVFCGRCLRKGITQRLILQHTVNSRGSAYTYFFCRNKQTGRCDAPHINAILVEDAVEAHYARVRFSPSFTKDVRAHIADVIDEEESAARLLHRQLTNELHTLDAHEDNLIELAASGTARAKITAKLRDIERQRRHLTERLNAASEDLSDSARLIDTCLTLLENPHGLYQRCDDEQRRLLNQAIFHSIYIDDEQITGHELKEPFARLHAVQNARGLTQSDKPDPGIPTPPQNASRAVSDKGDGPASLSGVEILLAGIDSDPCSSKPHKVEVAGIEPASFGIEAGLLRAQPAVLFSAPAITQASRRRAQPLFGFPTGPAAGPAGGVSLRCQIPGRRRSRADKFAYLALSGEGELILRLVGRYWFAAQDLRGCLRSPRPASPCLVMSKSKPVTPLLSCQRPDSAGRSHIIERSQWVARFLGRERENPGGCGWRTHRGDRQGRAGPDGRASPETRLWSHHGD
jgi:site-specific DNA recombinase